MLANLPLPLTLFLLAVTGAILGALVNWAIYAWAVFLKRSISPWQPRPTEASPRRTLDYFPVIGWPGRSRDSQLLGRGFWIRPMLIESIFLVGLPCFYLWIRGGGLTDTIQPGSWQTDTWLALYTAFLALLFIATFIDFDEQMIPDWVTIPGTLMALLFAALAPWSRLPEIVGLRGAGVIGHLDYLSPNGPAVGAPSSGMLWTALAIFAIWIWALLPKLSPWYVGWWTSLRMTYAYAFRPKRKTKCDLRVRYRQTPNETKLLCGLLVVGSIGIALAWQFASPTAWHSLYGSLLGLAFGGAMIWSIRIIGTFAMQQEAMGFGDVTLMAMIGATLGWQATLLAFVWAIVVVVLFLIIQVMVTGFQELAFGPYLCAGAVLLLFSWQWTWSGASEGVFQLGPVLLYILAGSLLLMAVMLIGLQWFKRLLGVE